MKMVYYLSNYFAGVTISIVTSWYLTLRASLPHKFSFYQIHNVSESMDIFMRPYITAPGVEIHENSYADILNVHST